MDLTCTVEMMAQSEHMNEVIQSASATQVEPAFLDQGIVARTAPAQKLACELLAQLFFTIFL
jgi:hypothetical protein